MRRFLITGITDVAPCLVWGISEAHAVASAIAELGLVLRMDAPRLANIRATEYTPPPAEHQPGDALTTETRR